MKNKYIKNIGLVLLLPVSLLLFNVHNDTYFISNDYLNDIELDGSLNTSMFFEDQYGFDDDFESHSLSDIGNADEDHVGTSIGDLNEYYSGGGHEEEWNASAQSFFAEANQVSVSDIISYLLNDKKRSDKTFDSFTNNFNLGELEYGVNNIAILKDEEVHKNTSSHNIIMHKPDANDEYTVNLGGGNLVIYSNPNVKGGYDNVRAVFGGNTSFIIYTDPSNGFSGTEDTGSQGVFEVLDSDDLNDLIIDVINGNIEVDDDENTDRPEWYYVPPKAELPVVSVVTNLVNELYVRYPNYQYRLSNVVYTNLFENFDKTLIIYQIAKKYTISNEIADVPKRTLVTLLEAATSANENHVVASKSKSLITSSINVLTPELDVTDGEHSFSSQVSIMSDLVISSGYPELGLLYRTFFSYLEEGNIKEYLNAYKVVRDQYISLRKQQIAPELYEGEGITINYDAFFSALDTMDPKLVLNILDEELPEEAKTPEVLEFIEELKDKLGIDSDDSASLAQLELKQLTEGITPEWKADAGVINGRDNQAYTHTATDGSKTWFLMEDGSVVLLSNTRLLLGKDDPIVTQFSTEANGNQKFWYYKEENTEDAKWHNYLVTEPNNLADELEVFFAIGVLELGKSIGTYALPVEDITILITGENFEGQEVSTAMAAGFLLLAIVPGSKVLKTVKFLPSGTTQWAIAAFKTNGKATNLSFRLVNGIVEFGGSLSKIINTKVGEEAHHIIAWALRENRVVQLASKVGFHMNAKINGTALQKFTKLIGEGLHGNHPAYNDFVKFRLNSFTGTTPKLAKEYLEKTLIPELLRYIELAKKSNLNLNEYFKLVVNPNFGL